MSAILRWYALRWRIEEYFRVLKSGCKVEELQHHAAERLERAIAIKMVVGWRIQLMVQLGREAPELPGELLFSDGELRVLATDPRRVRRTPRTSRDDHPTERMPTAAAARSSASSAMTLEMNTRLSRAHSRIASSRG